MISGWIIYEIACPNCLRIYCYLDLRQGSHGQPVRSASYVGRELKMKTDTVTAHLDHLSGAGLVALSRKTANSSTTIELIHNPARKRLSPTALPVEPSRGRARPRPTSPPPQRRAPSTPKDSDEIDLAAPASANDPVPRIGTLAPSEREPTLSPSGGHSDSDERDDPVLGYGTDLSSSGGRDPVAERGSGTRSARRYEERSASGSAENSPSVPVSIEEAERLIVEDLKSTRNASESIATKIAKDLVGGRPFDEHSEDAVDPRQLGFWKAKARGHLKAAYARSGG